MKQAARQKEKREYIVQVTIGEARNLKAISSNGLCDPFVKITVANKPPQVTDPEEKTTSVSWNQTFTFSGLELSETDLQKMEILLEIYSKNEFLLNDLIGSTSIGLGTLYKNMNHEFYNIWLPITFPDQKNRSKCIGRRRSNHSPSEGQASETKNEFDCLCLRLL
jgi:C2 domain